jgi:hypothetical protein
MGVSYIIRPANTTVRTPRLAFHALTVYGQRGRSDKGAEQE